MTEALEALGMPQETQAKYNNFLTRRVNIKVGDKILDETHILCSVAKAVLAKFTPKCEGPSGSRA